MSILNLCDSGHWGMPASFCLASTCDSTTFLIAILLVLGIPSLPGHASVRFPLGVLGTIKSSSLSSLLMNF
ncbi:hypothetical protein N658DRAFT_496133 [Parathielavia hyrcaniae]|uniref:Uncharacterized protein n=1 Tax=Parathielavia hyrcaniae TaxID=113614 RepID=A0AAN6T2I6_9PEZI|nr:hypothetical protein N658DRAFT_496133 [Parathielavia hyrcaniae]